LRGSTVKIAKVLVEAGFLEPPRFEQLVREGGGKSLTHILTQEISGRAVKELFTYELPIPFTRTRRTRVQSELQRDLSIMPAELGPLLERFADRLPEVARTLEQAGLLWPGTTQRIEEGFAANRAETLDTVARERLITVETLASFVMKENPVSLANRRRQAVALLLHNNLASAEGVQRAVERASGDGVSLTEALAAEAGLSQEHLTRALRGGLYLPKVNITVTDLSVDLLDLFPPEFVRRHLILPFARAESLLSLAMSDPLETPLIDALSLLSGFELLPHVATQRDLIVKLNQVLPTRAETAPAAGAAMSAPTASVEDLAAAEAAIPAEEVEPELLVDNVSTVQLVSTIIESAFATRATDIHIEPQEDVIRVRYRIDGRLKSIMQIPLEMHLPVVSRVKVLCDLDVTERRRPQDGHFTLNLGEDNIDLRVSVMQTHLGEKVVIRVLDEATVLRGLTELGMGPEEQARIDRLIGRPHGMLLAAGPTGSGKTTTLYACLNVLNSEDLNIVTIEDPAEYRIQGVNQVQVDPKIDLTFATGLRATLRQDPDVIMVGEIRDTETARIAVRAAMTGHLVLSTIHANSAAGVVDALLHLGVPAFSLANSLIGVVSQRLVRKLCPECREEFTPKKAIKRDLGLPEGSRRALWQPKGCPRCLDTGYFGRQGLFEVLEMTPSMREVILGGGSERQLAEAARAAGMKSLMETAHELLHTGVTSPEEVIRVVGLD
jgi:type IV pilus assembly protein PilB